MKLILTLLTLLTFTALIQDEKSQAILDNLSEKLNESNSFYIEFSVNIKNSVTGIDENQSGIGWVKGDHFLSSFRDNTIISNAIITCTIIKEEKTIYKTDADEEDDEMLNPKKLMTLWESGFKNKYGKETTLNGETVHVIYLYPKNPANVDYKTLTLYISKSANELKKIGFKMKDETIMTYLITKYNSNPVIDDSIFIFNKSKYPGYTVIEDN
ncbi:LolA family protein [Lutibacter citreus]|uniref:LolA family protein n=1 Tax=Lutibacter citreus TaxID=2138210 RepID=UPI000DBE26BD|nr:outer membrane lipoprotein carrier protein LolA [Lutibacter citreus]